MLTPLELDIMKAVWSRAPITVRAVQDAIRPGRQLAYTTVMTIMDRLYHKGFLTRTLRSRTHHYNPAINFADVRAEAVEVLIKNFFGSREKLREFLDSEPDNAEWETESPPVRQLDETLL
jgi:predicted transcriptional regulator